MKIEYIEPEYRHRPEGTYEIFTFKTTGWMETWLNIHAELIEDFKMSMTDNCILLVVKWKAVQNER